MIDYKIREDNQIESANFDLLFVSGDEATIQRIGQKFLLWLGEWFLDTSAGIPWLEILGQRPEPQFLSTVLRDVVAQDPGVDEVLRFEVSYAGETRGLSVIWRARLTGGTIAEDEVQVP